MACVEVAHVSVQKDGLDPSARILPVHLGARNMVSAAMDPASVILDGMENTAH